MQTGKKVNYPNSCRGAEMERKYRGGKARLQQRGTFLKSKIRAPLGESEGGKKKGGLEVTIGGQPKKKKFRSLTVRRKSLFPKVRPSRRRINTKTTYERKKNEQEIGRENQEK